MFRGLCQFSCQPQNLFIALLFYSASLLWSANHIISTEKSGLHNDNQPTRTPNNNHRRTVHFIPFPHNTLGSGDSISCQWGGGHTMATNTSSILDFTQQNAYNEGVCIPPSLSNTLHILFIKRSNRVPIAYCTTA